MPDRKVIDPGGAMLTLDADRLRQLAEALIDDETGAEYDEEASDWADPSTWTGLAHDEKHDAALARYLAAVRPSIVLELLAALDAAKHRLLDRPVHSTREAMCEAGDGPSVKAKAEQRGWAFGAVAEDEGDDQ